MNSNRNYIIKGYMYSRISEYFGTYDFWGSVHDVLTGGDIITFQDDPHLLATTRRNKYIFLEKLSKLTYSNSRRMYLLNT